MGKYVLVVVLGCVSLVGCTSDIVTSAGIIALAQGLIPAIQALADIVKGFA
jgi:hypothetical protein